MNNSCEIDRKRIYITHEYIIILSHVILKSSHFQFNTRIQTVELLLTSNCLAIKISILQEPIVQCTVE